MHVDSVFAAFLAGLGTGAHCALMCGPLACALQVRRLEYHAGRIVSYTLAGALGGGMGQAVLGGLRSGPLRAAPWVLLGVLVLMALGLDRQMPMSGLLLRLGKRLRLSRNLGWLTPLIPCGPLWLMLGAAVTTGNVLTGGLLLLSFSVGTVFWYAFIQSGVLKFQDAASPLMARRVQSTLVWCAALVLGWRLWSGGVNGCCSL